MGFQAPFPAIRTVILRPPVAGANDKVIPNETRHLRHGYFPVHAAARPCQFKKRLDAQLVIKPKLYARAAVPADLGFNLYARVAGNRTLRPAKREESGMMLKRDHSDSIADSVPIGSGLCGMFRAFHNLYGLELRAFILSQILRHFRDKKQQKSRTCPGCDARFAAAFPKNASCAGRFRPDF